MVCGERGSYFLGHPDIGCSKQPDSCCSLPRNSAVSMFMRKRENPVRRFFRLYIALTLLLLFAFPHLALADPKETLVITTNTYPPYVSADGQHSFFPELFDAIGKKMHVSFTFHFAPWKRGEANVKSHTAWATIPYKKTEEREKDFDFSAPLYQSTARFFLYSSNGTKPQIGYGRLSDLHPFSIGGVQGYYYTQWFKDAHLNVDYALSEEQNLKRLALGRIDMTPVAETLGWYLIDKLFPPDKAKNFYTLDKPLTSGDLFLMTAKDYPDGKELLARFNIALAEIKNDGTMLRLLQKHGLVIAY